MYRVIFVVGPLMLIEAVIRRLSLTNWVRTLGWTGRAVVVAWLLVEYLKTPAA